ncbi:hypothetical protein [Desulfobacca acetoxidans]
MDWNQKIISPWIACNYCHGLLESKPDQIIMYLANFPEKPKCKSCGKELDWWLLVVDAIETNFFFKTAMELAGAQSMVLVEKFRRDSSLELDFGNYDIPADALIVAINITPQGGPLFPAERIGSYFSHDRIPHKLLLHPTFPRNQVVPEEVELAIMVTYYFRSGDMVREYLFDAFYEFGTQTRIDQITGFDPQWNRVVIPAHQAMELLIGRFVCDAMREHSIKIKFNYAKELKIIPLIAKLFEVLPLPVHIANKVDELRTLRNDIIHEGIPKIPLTRRNTATLLASALFTFHYINFVRSKNLFKTV